MCNVAVLLMYLRMVPDVMPAHPCIRMPSHLADATVYVHIICHAYVQLISPDSNLKGQGI